ncbi:hypothetical protein ACT3UJ_07015 [Halomonas sp. 86]|uniref:hypothetical protein n=1 Tax=unclassified Halomonas TaxID=2609666 RepID=UPI0040347883
MTDLTLFSTPVDPTRLDVGTLLIRKKPFLNDHSDGEERVTHDGSLWRIEQPMGRDGGYKLVCDDTKVWSFAMAETLLSEYHVLPPDFKRLMVSLASSSVRPGFEALLTSFLNQLKEPINAVDSLDIRTQRFEAVLKFYAMLRGDADFDVQSMLSDLLCDGMHFAVIDDNDFLHAIETAEDNFLAETHADVER